MTDLAATHRADRFEAARAVADATLYEGYVLYPYRASAVKNQMRWQFGVLVPPRWVEAGGAERSWLATECLVDPGRSPRLTVRIRFLQIQRRTIAVSTDDGFAPVDALVVGTTNWVPWDEAVERVVDLPIMALTPREEAHREVPFAFEAGVAFEAITDPAGEVIGRAERRWDDVAGAATVDAAETTGSRALPEGVGRGAQHLGLVG